MECAHVCRQQGVELQVLFYRLVRLLHYPIELIFVFDGPMRPSVKRGHDVLKGTHWLTREMQELLNTFGIPWYTVSA
jgi:Holliday junction resolvase YEN1